MRLIAAEKHTSEVSRTAGLGSALEADLTHIPAENIRSDIVELSGVGISFEDIFSHSGILRTLSGK